MLVRSLVGGVALGIEGSSGSVPSVELAQEAPHDDDHGFLSGHGEALAVVEFAVEALAPYQGQDDLAEDLAQQRPIPRSVLKVPLADPPPLQPQRLRRPSADVGSPVVMRLSTSRFGRATVRSERERST